MLSNLQDRILSLKQQKDLCILAHCYQRQEIIEVADFVGDSYALAKKAAAVRNQTVIMCGVRFMAETVKILAPEKKVILPNAMAGCPMAEQLNPEMLAALREQYAGYTVVAYINTTAELKTLCDVCVTSSSAVKILRAMPEKDILFIPDRNLGSYIQKQLPEKNIELVHGGCPTHIRATAADVLKMRQRHPQALLLVHPECLPAVVEQADYVGSTTGIMQYAKDSDCREFIIGTENSIVDHLQHDCPDKRFYPLSLDLVCHNMLMTTLTDLLHACQGDGGEEIEMEETTRLAAKRCIDQMIAYGG